MSMKTKWRTWDRKYLDEKWEEKKFAILEAKHKK